MIMYAGEAPRISSIYGAMKCGRKINDSLDTGQHDMQKSEISPSGYLANSWPAPRP